MNMRAEVTSNFIDEWAGKYTYIKEHIYERYIPLKRPTRRALEELYEWKNGRRLSNKKQKSLEEKIIMKIGEIQYLINDFNLNRFETIFSNVAAIWRIFLLHIINCKFPIFDQHVYRAMRYLEGDHIGNEFELLKKPDEERYRVYKEEYVPFVREVEAKTGKSGRTVDKALWTFGKELKRRYKIVDRGTCVPQIQYVSPLKGEVEGEFMEIIDCPKIGCFGEIKVIFSRKTQELKVYCPECSRSANVKIVPDGKRYRLEVEEDLDSILGL